MGIFNSFLRPGQNDHHTSGLVQNQSQITGSVSRETFADRKRINQQRVAVGAYTFAGLHQLHRESPLIERQARASAYQRSASSPISRSGLGAAGPTVRPVIQVPRMTKSFREPPSRGHNPFA